MSLYVIAANAVERKRRGRGKGDNTFMADALAIIYFDKGWDGLSDIHPLTIAKLMAVGYSLKGREAPRINVASVRSNLSKFRKNAEYIGDDEMSEALDRVFIRLKNEYRQVLTGNNVPAYLWSMDTSDDKEIVVGARRIVPSADDLSAMQTAAKALLDSYPSECPTWTRH